MVSDKRIYSDTVTSRFSYPIISYLSQNIFHQTMPFLNKTQTKTNSCRLNHTTKIGEHDQKETAKNKISNKATGNTVVIERLGTQKIETRKFSFFRIINNQYPNPWPITLDILK